jgi:predicted DNA-binding transcriptional regulator AlpA
MPKRVSGSATAIKRRLLTRAETAELLGVSRGTLSRWAAERIGPPFVKMGPTEKASVRYPEDGIEEFLAARTKHPK